MTDFAALYGDTIRFTTDRTMGGLHNLHCWFSAETAYLPIKCRTAAIVKDTIRKIQAACVASGNAKPKLDTGV